MTERGEGARRGRHAIDQCRKPSGWLGRFVLWRMNAGHSALTDWGLRAVTIASHHVILDVGCGGGETIRKLARVASQGRVCGVDYSDESVAASMRRNADAIQAGRVEIRKGELPPLPFADETFDLVTAVETHFWWSDLPGGLREILRVLRRGGKLLIVAEVYKGAASRVSQLAEKAAARTGMTVLSEDEHRRLLADAGFVDVAIDVEPRKGWIRAMGRRP
jgi:SAM-dependent methyltransferase